MPTIRHFPFVKQLEDNDSGYACISMIAKHFGRSISLESLKQDYPLSALRISSRNISDAAEAVGLSARIASINHGDLFEEAPLPCIARWAERHFVVIYRVSRVRVWIADPTLGLRVLEKKEFLQSWSADGQVGEVIVLEPTSRFLEPSEPGSQKGLTLRYWMPYLRPHRRFLIQVLAGIFISFLFSLVAPFLAQSLMDEGIIKQNIDFVVIILVSQFAMFLGGMVVGLLNGWIMLHVGMQLNFSIISDFLTRILNLRISFFDSKRLSDILQRFRDNNRIQTLLTISSTQSFLSLFNLVAFGMILAFMSSKLFIVLIVGNVLSLGWLFLFLRLRKKLDYQVFEHTARNSGKLIQIIQGIQDIKVNNSEVHKRWEWQNTLTGLFRVSLKAFGWVQVQQSGSNLIGQILSISVSFISAKAVIDGEFTLGSMMAVNMIVGQFGAAIGQLPGFVLAVQDAKIGLERLGEVHSYPEEESANQHISTIPPEGDIVLQGVSFSYGHASNHPLVLDDVNLRIQRGKVTAIVGPSGGGKTTLMKLLFRFYEPTIGKICMGETPIRFFSLNKWRDSLGVVLQNGYIFSDSVTNNIVQVGETIDFERLSRSSEIANINEFIESLPTGYETVLGESGLNVSEGQKQRILLARAVYKDPQFLFLDEATSALDAENERTIMDRLNNFFRGRTVVIIAHRLSTVQHADRIVVLNKGKIVEQGTHSELVRVEGEYYNLVRNQLSLGR